jgi:hypothetical protein
MRLDRSAVFPFAEFDPLLRRDLNAVLESVRREIEQTGNVRRTVRDRLALRDQLVQFLKEKAKAGERCPLRLYDAAMHKFGSPELV